MAQAQEQPEPNSNGAMDLPMLNEHGIPPFESLPLREGDPIWSAWGLYGDKDELGTLNRLTDERVLAAARREILSGVRYASFSFLLPQPPLCSRTPFLSGCLSVIGIIPFRFV